MGNSTNMSATYTDGRRVGPSNGAQKSAKSARKRSGRANNDPEEAIVDSGDFQ